MDKYDCLKLENQLCFPLYACSKEIVRKYTPFLNALDLTYTQYIALMVLWEKKETTVSELGRCLYLDSGTLTPLLKKLEAKELLTKAGYALTHANKMDIVVEYCLMSGHTDVNEINRVLFKLGLQQLGD